MDKIHDVAIIGGGPAGYTAALYSARAGLDTVIIERMSIGGQMVITDVIDNYPGYDEGIEGYLLGMKMQAGAERFGARTEYGEVIKAELKNEPKRIITDSSEILAKSVIVATGANPRKLGITGEKELTGRGVHYCAHCDGRFYKDKTVAVVGGGNTAVSDALYLSNLAKKVILIHRRDSFKATKIYLDALMKATNVELVKNSVISELVLNDGLKAIKVKDSIRGEEREIQIDGLFVSIGRDPATKLFDELKLDENGYVIADETTKTNVSGVFAAGDVRTKSLRQVVTAVSDGATAAHFAEEYLNV
ncbi:MAG: thioredoxin-disulfide reductase [Clostridia bacterium]|nr:thioredoxin-disulfide reductase [Clostridia bacterium]